MSPPLKAARQIHIGNGSNARRHPLRPWSRDRAQALRFRPGSDYPIEHGSATDAAGWWPIRASP